MNRQRLILFILLPILAVALVVGYLRVPRQKTVQKLTFTPGATSAPSPSRPLQNGNARLTGSSQLHLELLDADLTPTQGAYRNLFGEASREQQRQTGKQGGAVQPPVVPLPPPPLPPTPLESMRRSLAAYNFIGVMTINNRKTVFFNKAGEVVPVRVGDHLLGKYEAIAVSDEFLTVKTPDTGEQLSLPLLDKQLPTIIQRRRNQSRNQGV